MFCVLNVEQKERNLFEKIFRFLCHDEYELKTIPVFKGAPFYVLNVKTFKIIDWDKVVENTGKCSKRLIVNGNIKIPNKKELGIFKSNLLYNKVFQNTILQILANNKINKNPQHIVIYDKNAKCIDFTIKLVKYASKLTVVTENKDKYMKVCDDILEDTGLCISLLSEFNGGKIKIDTDRNVASIDTRDGFLNITNAENLMANDIYKKLILKGIDEYNFYSALYELCGVFSLGECIFEIITVNNEKKHIDTVTFS